MPPIVSPRSYATLTDAHLAHLVELADADHLKFTRSSGKKATFRDRRVAVVLAQGAALHYLDGKNGVKDLDVYTFYAAVHGAPLQSGQRLVHADFGLSELGRPDHFDPKIARSKKWASYEGRRVDLMVRDLPVEPESSTQNVTDALRAWLVKGRNEPKRQDGRKSTAKALSEKAMIWLWPAKPGTTIWSGGRGMTDSVAEPARSGS